MPSATAGHGVGVDIASTLKAAGIIGLWTYDLARGLVFTDKAMAITYGVDPDLAANGLPPDAFQKAFHPDDLPGASYALKMAVANCTEYSMRYRLIHPDGSVSMIEARGRPFVSEGKTIRMTGANFDVTGSLAGHRPGPLGEQTRLALDFLARRGWLSRPDSLGLISGHQLRAARELLGWSIARLADAAGVPSSAILRLERNNGITPAAGDAVRQLKANLEMAGISFTTDDGVALKP